MSQLITDLRWLSMLILGAVFALSATAKLYYWSRFRDTLGSMEVLPRSTLKPVAVVLPMLELVTGISVGLGFWLYVFGPVVVGLLVMFLGVLVHYRLRGGKELVCGCFADFDHKTSTSRIIVRNILLLAVALPLLSSDQQAARGRAWDEYLAAATVVLGVFVVWRLLAEWAELLNLARAAQSYQ